MRTIKLALGIVLAVAGASLLFGWAPLVGWWNFGSVTPEERISVFERRLTGMFGGAVVRLPDGAMALVRRSDVAGIGETSCRREWECSGRRRCGRVYIRFHCGYRVRLRDGGDAAAYLMLSAMSSLIPRVGEYGPPREFAVDELDIEDARRELCTLGFGCGSDAGPPAAPSNAAQSLRDCKDGFCGPEMMAIPKGKYRRGSTEEEVVRLRLDEGRGAEADLFTSEQPAHEVEIGYRLAIGVFEVTQAEWNACAAEAACPAKGVAGRDAGLPVAGVSWNDVTGSYVPWLNRKLGLAGPTAYRLPSDAEWEYAARAGTQTRFAAGDLLTTRQARFYTPSSAPVGSYPPNPFGLHDMTGNAPEWVEDCWERYEAAPRDGSAYEKADCSSRTYRDADWHSLPWYMRSASRHLASPEHGYANQGFRLARTLVE